MFQNLKKYTEYTLYAVIVVLLILTIFIPKPKLNLDIKDDVNKVSNENEQNIEDNLIPKEDIKKYSSSFTARLFGWRPTAPVVKKQPIVKTPTVKPPTTTSLITYVGRVATNGSLSSYYIFKNTRSKQIYKIRIGEVQDNFKIISKEENRFLIEIDNKKYYVKY